jgi:hypothetical protein
MFSMLEVEKPGEQSLQSGGASISDVLDDAPIWRRKHSNTITNEAGKLALVDDEFDRRKLERNFHIVNRLVEPVQGMWT